MRNSLNPVWDPTALWHKYGLHGDFSNDLNSGVFTKGLRPFFFVRQPAELHDCYERRLAWHATDSYIVVQFAWQTGSRTVAAPIECKAISSLSCA